MEARIAESFDDIAGRLKAVNKLEADRQILLGVLDRISKQEKNGSVNIVPEELDAVREALIQRAQKIEDQIRQKMPPSITAREAQQQWASTPIRGAGRKHG
jgi:hypothetical protein